jgi:thiosulfate/3-mercaptopyruvate sulfurtransferase
MQRSRQIRQDSKQEVKVDGNPLIITSELSSRLDDPDLRILDCRFDLLNPAAGHTAYRAGHIPGAVYVNLDEDLANPVSMDSGRHPLPAVDAVCATFGRFGIDGSTSVVVYDSGSGGIAARAWWLLRWLGHDNVSLLDGGFDAWAQDLGVVQSGIHNVEARQFIGSPKYERVLTTTEILGRDNEIAKLQIIDARDAARFEGEFEPIDTVAGHIPGTRNMPFTESLQANGRWKTVSELQAIWAKQLATASESGWAVMCGSGVTACHLALSSALAGCPEPRLYAGSWSEWIRDPRRPIALGPAEPDAMHFAAEPA